MEPCARKWEETTSVPKRLNRVTVAPLGSILLTELFSPAMSMYWESADNSSSMSERTPDNP